MRRSWKRARAAEQQKTGPQLSGSLTFTDDPQRPAVACTGAGGSDLYESSAGGSGGSPASGIAPPSDPLSEDAILARTSESGWYMVDDDGFNRPVAYRRTPRFDDRTERTAQARMLFRSVDELPEWVQASNQLWLPRCFVSAAEPPRAGSPDGRVESVPVPSLGGDGVLDAPQIVSAESSDAATNSISGVSDADAEGEAVPAVQEPSDAGCVWTSFRILSTEQVQSSKGSAVFTRYRLCTSTTNGHSWVVYKRYSDFENLRQRLVEAGVSGIAGLAFPKKKLRRKNSVREETVEVRTEALQRWLDELLTVQADHELLDVFMGAQRHMRHLMGENRALQQETVRLVRKTEVLAGERDDERRNRRKFEEQLDEVEAARADAVAKLQDMRMEVQKWQAATRKAERERDHASVSAAMQQQGRQHPQAASSAKTVGFDAKVDTPLRIDSTSPVKVSDDHGQTENGQFSQQRRLRDSAGDTVGRTEPSPLRNRQTMQEDQRLDGSGASPSRVVRRMPGLDVPLGVAYMERGDHTAVSVEPEPEPEPQPEPQRPRSASRTRRSVTGMPPLFTSSGSNGNRMAAMRSRMKQAMQKEEDPNRLTELVLESMEFGDALETERTALQDRFERILKVQALHQSSSYVVKDLSHIK